LEGRSGDLPFLFVEKSIGEKANVLKKSINSANICSDTRKRSLTAGETLKKVSRHAPGFCRASDYGRFSAHSLFFIPLECFP
jgi:hypothetical protein